MKAGAAAAAAVLACVLGPAPAAAQSWHGAVTLASDDVVRGLSRSDGDAALLVDLGLRSDGGWGLSLGLSAPAYASRGGRLAYALALGHGRQWTADWALQTQVAHYGYAGRAAAQRYDYDELSLRLVWGGRVHTTLAWSPNLALPPGAGATTAPAWTLALGAQLRLVGRLALDAGVARLQRRGAAGPSYGYGSIGLSGGVGPVRLQLTAIDGQAPVAGPHWVASAGWVF